MRRHLFLAALIGAICAALVSLLALFDPTLFDTEWLLRDRFTRILARNRTLDPRIRFVQLSDKSIAALEQLNYGRPPYSRDVYATVVRELRAAGAAVIVFDILFTEEDVNHPDADREFAAALEGVPVVMAAQPGIGRAIPPRLEPLLWNIPGGRSSNVLAPIFTPTAIGAIPLAARSEGRSAVVHTYDLAHPLAANRWLPSLALETARTFEGVQRSGRYGSDHFRFGSTSVPLHRGSMTLRWSPSENRYYELAAVVLSALAREDPSAQVDRAKLAAMTTDLRGKIVIVGYTAAGLWDLRPNPLSTKAPGLEVHANAIDNLLNRRFDREAPRATLLAIIVFAALFGAALRPIRSQVLSALLAVGAIVLVLAIAFVAQRSGLLLPQVASVSSLALTYVTITVWKLLSEQEQSAMLRTTFGRYVSPQILEHILAHPDRVRLGGDRRELTILFSDIRGFTSISEASEPEDVVEMLNEYLTRMVEILLDHGGTLDKFIGDAVMGFWNAPAADPDHAPHAVACAVEMVRETARLGEKWVAAGKTAIRIGVGVNTGEAVVGNIGAAKVFSYTVIGDAVNLASRLEGKNKDYGTEIIVSEFTLARIGDAFDTVYLDDVKVKGKERAVKIYQVKT